MASIEQLHLAHLPSTVTIHGALFTQVRNADFLRAQLLAGNADFEYAFIDASMLISRTHLLAAVFRAINVALYSQPKSRNVHSEIVFNLSPNNNIAESLRRFGVSDDSVDLVVIKVGLQAGDHSTVATFDAVQMHMLANVQGMIAPLTDEELAKHSDVAAIRKVYKLNAGGLRKKDKARQNPTDRPAASEGDDRHVMEVTALASMALKGY